MSFVRRAWVKTVPREVAVGIVRARLEVVVERLLIAVVEGSTMICVGARARRRSPKEGSVVGESASRSVGVVVAAARRSPFSCRSSSESADSASESEDAPSSSSSSSSDPDAAGASSMEASSCSPWPIFVSVTRTGYALLVCLFTSVDSMAINFLSAEVPFTIALIPFEDAAGSIRLRFAGESCVVGRCLFLRLAA